MADLTEEEFNARKAGLTYNGKVSDDSLPSGPKLGDTYQMGDKTLQYDGSMWMDVNTGYKPKLTIESNTQKPDLTESEFKALKASKSQSVAQPIQSDSPVQPKETGMGNYIENMARGLSGGFESQAAGLADAFNLAPQKWLDKIESQKRWIAENQGAGVGKIGADAITGTAASLALPEINATGVLAKPLAQIGQDIGSSGFLGSYLNPGSTEDRLKSGAIDAIGAGLFSTGGQILKPIVQGGVAGYRAVHDLFSDSGRMSKLAEYVRQAVPEGDISTVISNLENYKQLIPSSVKRGINYKPTAAEVGQHTGLSTLQDYASGINPGQYISRELENIGAESKLMNAVADPEKLAEKIGFRTAKTEPLYAIAKQSMVPVDRELVQLLKRPEMRKALNEAITTGANSGISPPTRTMLNQVLSGRNSAQISGDAMHHIKLGIDHIISRLDKGAKTPRDKADLESFNNLRGKFESWRETNMPDYAKAQSTFRQLSKPVNRRNAAQAIIDETYPHGTLDPAALHSTDPLKLGDIIADPDKLVQKGTDFGGSTYDNTFTNRQKDLMSNVSESQRRRAQSELTSGSGFQHDNSSNMAARGVGAIAQAGSGLPGMYQSATANVLSKLGSQNLKMQSKLGDILLDPKRTAELFKVAPRKGVFSNLDGNILNRIPGLIGYLSSEQYMNQ